VEGTSRQESKDIKDPKGGVDMTHKAGGVESKTDTCEAMSRRNRKDKAALFKAVIVPN